MNMSELVWVRVAESKIAEFKMAVFMKLSLREDNKVSESKMAVSESNMADFKMAAIIKLSENEQVNFFLCKMAESKIAEFKMAAII